MIPERIQEAINILSRASNLNMIDWQRLPEDHPEFGDGVGSNQARSEDQLHACGNSACFAGYVAISPEFQNAGGFSGPAGNPHLRDPKYAGIHWTGHRAIEKWLGIDEDATRLLIFGHKKGFTAPHYSPFYGKAMEDVTPENVIEKLELLLAGKFSEQSLTRAHFLRAANRWYHDTGRLEVIEQESAVEIVERGANVPLRVYRDGKPIMSTKFISKDLAFQEITDFA